MIKNNQSRLAIVIPAWRALHFSTALTSLRNQTDRRFRLYIGDDGSPDDLRSIVESATTGLDIVYHRFPENLGGQDLVAHWHRCISLTQHEPWIWLFSDDDIADPECVASFYESLERDSGRTTLFRFNTEIIDGDNRVIRQPPPHPENEEALEMLIKMLDKSSRFWGAPDHIFSKAAYEQIEGFVKFPKALYADMATWVAISAKGNARTIPKALIRFRRHEHGTSSGMLDKFAHENVAALGLFLKFSLGTTKQIAPQRLPFIRRLACHFFFEYLYRRPELHSFLIDPQSIDFCWRALGGPRWSVALRHRYYRLRLRLRNLPGLRAISYWRYRRNSSSSVPPSL